MGKDEFNKMLMDTKAKYLLNEGAHIANINRHGQLVALYALGKRLYEIVYNKSKEVLKIEEVSAMQVLRDYMDVL